MKSSWLPYDASLDDNTRKGVANLMRTFLYIIPILAIFLATIDFIYGFTSIALTTLSVPIFCAASLYFLNKGQINVSMIIITAIMIVATSIICFIGGGIHEIGIIIFPVIVFFSSLVMNIRGVVITTSIVVVCLALIVLEEHLNIFPGNEPVASLVNLTICLTVLILHTFITFSFTSITKNNLLRIRQELHNQEQYKEGITQNLDEKTELLRLVHHRVKNNLLLINSLIELEAYGKPEVKLEFKEITDSIHTIARAHDPLYHTDDYKQVSIRPYLEKMIASFIQSRSIKAMELQLSDFLIYHQKALLLGIILQKILSSIQSLESHELKIEMEKIGESFILKIVAQNKQAIEVTDTAMIQSLIRKIEGQLTMSKKSISISFSATD